METIVTTSRQQTLLVADAIEHVVSAMPTPCIGVSTGSTPLPIYAELVRRHLDEGLSFANAHLFMLDEYLGLPEGHPQAYRTFLDEHLVGHLDIRAERLHGPNVHARDIPAECAAYERTIESLGGIDLQVLGIGADGHIGFNEPGSSLGSSTRIKTLAELTIADNARFFTDAESVPRHVVTQGIATIRRARHVILIATGAAKAAAIAAACEGPVTTTCPASALQFHPHTTVIVDEEAGANLRFSSYYKATFDNKPTWQRI